MSYGKASPLITSLFLWALTCASALAFGDEISYMWPAIIGWTCAFALALVRVAED